MFLRSVILHLFLSFSFCAGAQKVDEAFVAIATNGKRLSTMRFLSDSTVRLRSIRDLSIDWLTPVYSSVYKYSALDTTILLLKDTISDPEAQFTVGIKPFELSANIVLDRINGGFINWKDSVIYVNANNIGNRNTAIIIINGKIIYQPLQATDGNGLLRKRYKPNRVLRRKLKKMNPSNTSVEIVRGINAYLRFGMKHVQGVILITSNKGKTADNKD